MTNAFDFPSEDEAPAAPPEKAEANPFDQFDLPSANPFDQFDEPDHPRPEMDPYADGVTYAVANAAVNEASVAAARRTRRAVQRSLTGPSEVTTGMGAGIEELAGHFGEQFQKLGTAPIRALTDPDFDPTMEGVPFGMALALQGGHTFAGPRAIPGGGPAAPYLYGNWWASKFSRPPTPIVPPLPSVIPSPIKPAEGSPSPAVLRSEMAKTGDPLIDAVSDHPVVNNNINNPIVDRTKIIPNTDGASEPLGNPTIYQDPLGLKEVTSKGVTLDTAEGSAVHENMEQFAIKAMREAGMDEEEALSVSFWEFGEKAEDAFYAAHGMDPADVEAQLTPNLNQVASKRAAELAERAPLDELRPASQLPPDLFRGTYPGGDPAKAGPGPIAKPTLEAVERGRAAVARKLLEDRKNTLTVDDARDVGLIGPDKPEPTFEDSPSDIADSAFPPPASLSSARTPLGQRERPPGHKPGEYDKRGKEWIDKIDAPEDVRDVIEKIAADHDYYPEARGGAASPAARDAVAEAAGIDPKELNNDYFSTNFDNDGKVRAVVQALEQVKRDFAAASEKMANEPSPENAAAMLEQELRLGHVVEYVLGKRAEAGRSLNIFKEALVRQAEHTNAVVDLTKKEAAGEAPKGTVPLVDAVKEVEDNLRDVAKEPKPGEKPKEARPLGIQKLITQAKNLVENARKGAEGPEKVSLPPELEGLVGEAKKVLKRFGADKDAQLDAFREELDRLASGEGKLGDVVERARDLLKEEKPKAGKEPKPPTDRGKLMGAAKRLVAAADKLEPEVKAGVPAETQRLMEATRQAVGTLKTMGRYPEFAELRRALSEGNAEAAQAAAKVLVEAEGKREPGLPRPPVEHDVVMGAARRLAEADLKAAPGERPPLPPDITDLLEQTKTAAEELGAEQKLVLDRLVEQAEKQAADMVKTGAVKEPAEALLPELQGLVDKTGRVVDRFGGITKAEKAAELLARTGRTVADQERLASSVKGMTPDRVAKVLEKIRNSPEEGRPHWFVFAWLNWLLSGPVTHAGYAVVNTFLLGLERGIYPAAAAGIGKVRGQNVSVMAPIYGSLSMVKAVPEALSAAWEAAKTGNRVPLASELRLFERGEESPQAKGVAAPFLAPGPEWGMWKRVFNETQLDAAAVALGWPQRMANSIHTLFKTLGLRAAMSTKAFEAAHADGVTGDKFWARYKYHLENPTDEALKEGTTEAYSGALMEKLGEKTGAAAHALQDTFVKAFFPFMHIPFNAVKKGLEATPALNLLLPSTRDALLGGLGEPARNLAVAKMVVGGSVLGYAVHKYLAGELTGDYPRDQKERQAWQLENKPENSIKVGSYWVNLDRFPPVGAMFHAGATVASIYEHAHNDPKATWMENASENFGKALIALMSGIGNGVGSETGFQTLKHLTEMIEGRDENAAMRFIGQEISSLIPFSSFVGQTASFLDPEMRQANDVLSQVKYKIPGLRGTLPPKLDPLYGEPLPNPGSLQNMGFGRFGFRRQAPVDTDPAKMEMLRLNIAVAAPEKRIDNVTLPPLMYDEYQQQAGQLVKTALTGAVNSPGWNTLSDAAKRLEIKTIIENARGKRGAAAIIESRHPEIFQQRAEDKMDQINGIKPSRLRDRPPIGATP
jgi:hypothetical protein